MRSIGTVRKVDMLGRIVIPKEIRNKFDIRNDDPMEIFVENHSIILKKYVNTKACQVTGEISEDNLELANGKVILSRNAAERLIAEIKRDILE